MGDPANECITGTGTRGLFLMPLGSARREHVSHLSVPALKAVIAQVRNWFDVILIDTGPVLGSLEASVASMAADEVILTVARGEKRPLVDRSIELLLNANASIRGIVLNRASPGDILTSGFSSSASRTSESAAPASKQLTPVEHEMLRLDPIGSAVLALAVTSEQ
jgi:Mrp family chromosome partitioning ATPase